MKEKRKHQRKKYVKIIKSMEDRKVIFKKRNKSKRIRMEKSEKQISKMKKN